MATITRKDRMVITRGVYWLNRQRAGLKLIEQAGYDVDTTSRKWGWEHRISRDGATLALLHHFDDQPEVFAFLFEPEATTPLLRRVWWRLTHPFTRLKDDPRRASALDEKERP